MVYQDIKYLFLEECETITYLPSYRLNLSEYKQLKIITNLDQGIDLVINLLTWDKLSKYNLLPQYLQIPIKYNLPYHNKSTCPHRFINRTICPEGTCGLYFPYADLYGILQLIPNDKTVGILTSNILAGLIIIMSYKIIQSLPLHKIFKYHKVDRITQTYLENFFCYVKEHHLFLSSDT